MLLDFPRVIHYFFTTNGEGTAILKASVSGAAYLLMLQSWFPPVTTAWNPPAWSVSCEMFFYIAFIFLMKPLLKFENKMRAILLCYLIPLFLFGLFLLDFDVKSATFHLAWLALPPIRIFEFFIGIFLYGLVKSKSRVAPWVQKNSSLTFWCALVVSVGLTQFYEAPIERNIFSHLLLVPLFCAIILSASFDEIFFSVDEALASSRWYLLYITNISMLFGTSIFGSSFAKKDWQKP